MQPLIIEELPYSSDSTLLFRRFRGLELPVFLDSAYPFSARGRYDIIAANPVHSICSEPNSGESSNPFARVKTALNDYLKPINNDYHLPFVGGAMGYFGYDLGRQLETLPSYTRRELTTEDAVVGIYSWAIIVDHRQQRTALVAHPATSKEQLEQVYHQLHSDIPGTGAGSTDFELNNRFELNGTFKSNMSKPDYQRAFESIKSYIRAGDCYQINLAQRFSAGYQGDPWQAYESLREIAAAPYSGYMEVGASAVLSLSPERLLNISNRRVTTSPIKGTMPRSNDPEQDQQLARQLLDSPKDKAENLMIVDLLRNDLGKSCIPGSIQVDQLFELQSFATVHHLVSTISGQLADTIDPLDVLAQCFPGGSITGAPKVRAMQIIEELEPDSRGIYCGSLGYISCDGQMDTNIAIRTLLCEQGNIHCWAGGGIVADSQCESEYQECFNKVDKLMAALSSNGPL